MQSSLFDFKCADHPFAIDVQGDKAIWVVDKRTSEVVLEAKHIEYMGYWVFKDLKGKTAHLEQEGKGKDWYLYSGPIRTRSYVSTDTSPMLYVLSIAARILIQQRWSDEAYARLHKQMAVVI